MASRTINGHGATSPTRRGAEAEAAARAELEAAEAAAAAAAARQKSLEALGKKIAGIAAIYFIEKGVGKGLEKAKLKIPSSLATMLLWMGGLKALEEINGDAAQSNAISDALAPAVVECARKRWEEVARIVEKAGEEPQTLLRAMGATAVEARPE